MDWKGGLIAVGIAAALLSGNASAGDRFADRSAVLSTPRGYAEFCSALREDSKEAERMADSKDPKKVEHAALQALYCLTPLLAVLETVQTVENPSFGGERICLPAPDGIDAFALVDRAIGIEAERRPMLAPGNGWSANDLAIMTIAAEYACKE